MITISAFRSDYSEFSDAARFPNPVIAYWLQIAGLLLNTAKFGMPAPFEAQSDTVAAGGAGYALGDKIVLAGGSFSTPVTLGVDTFDTNGAVITASILDIGAYTALPPTPTAQKSTTGNGAGATFNMTFASGAYCTYDLVTELFVAHNVSIERRAQDEADAGAVPGTSTGPISAKSAANLSVSFDVAAAAVEGMGDLNLTIYGTRLAKLIKMFGMGPITVVGSCFGGWLNGPGWSGPIFNQGISWDS